jgi:hypothetical protein
MFVVFDGNIGLYANINMSQHNGMDSIKIAMVGFDSNRYKSILSCLFLRVIYMVHN